MVLFMKLNISRDRYKTDLDRSDHFEIINICIEALWVKIEFTGDTNYVTVSSLVHG
jgi:hypothetical protein